MTQNFKKEYPTKFNNIRDSIDTTIIYDFLSTVLINILSRSADKVYSLNLTLYWRIRMHLFNKISLGTARYAACDGELLSNVRIYMGSNKFSVRQSLVSVI